MTSHLQSLKELSTEIAPVLQKIYTKSIQTHIIPSDWKKARICPILKKGDKDRPENYRPISLTCICSKILEYIITSCVMSHLEANNILYPLRIHSMVFARTGPVSHSSLISSRTLSTSRQTLSKPTSS